jgi:hypothetical protein
MAFTIRSLPERAPQHLPYSPAERKWVLGFAAIVLLITTLPYILGYAAQGHGYRFTGFVFAVEDGNSYIAKMLSGSYGAWLFRTPYTAVPQAGVLMFLPYILLGKLAAPPGLHEQLVALFHIFRIFAGYLAIRATYDFLAFYLKSITLRRFGLALVTLGGGLGWVLLLIGRPDWLGSLPLEFYSPETFGFLSLYGIPHLAAARALLLWTLLAYLRFQRDEGQQTAVPAAKAGLLWLLAGVLQPLAAVVIGFVILVHLAGLAVWQLWGRREALDGGWVAWRRATAFAGIAGILPGILVVYNAVSLAIDPFLKAWMAQNIITSPHPLHYLLAFGVILPFAVVGAKRALSISIPEGWLLAGWAAALPVLAYLPVNLQRRLPEGVWVAGCALALLAIEGRWAGEPPRRRLWLLAPLLLCFPSTLLLLFGGFQVSGTPAVPAFRSVDEVTLFEHLAGESQPGCLVLASFETGNALPAWAPLRVVIGHGPESAGLAELRPQVQRFYSAGPDDAWRRDWLSQLGACYVFWGPAEQGLGDWDPRQAAFLQPAAHYGNYWAFSVQDGSP